MYRKPNNAQLIIILLITRFSAIQRQGGYLSKDQHLIQKGSDHCQSLWVKTDKFEQSFVALIYANYVLIPRGKGVSNLQILHFMSVTLIRNKRFLRHVNLCYSHGECHSYCHELPKYCANVFKNGEQGNLDGANIFRLFHHVTKSSESETKGIKSCRDNQR